MKLETEYHKSIMSWFNINTGVLGLLILFLGWTYWSTDPFSVEKNPLSLPWVPIDVRKTKVYVSQTRDASMFTELTRRTAIIGNPQRFKYGYKGSDNGSLEGNFISGICIIKRCPIHDVLYDAADANDHEFCVLDGNDVPGEVVYDAGNADTVVCGV